MRRGNRLSTSPPELNLVPLLDMVSLLVQVLLLHVHFGALADVPATPVGAPIGEDSAALALAIDIGEQGYIVRWNDQGEGRSEVLPCKPPCTDTEQYPTRDLQSLLGTIKDQHPSDAQAVVRPISDVRFDVIARTMDLVRASGAQPLFPDIAIGTGPAK
jgi:biopolymer transport protein ExbD